MIMWGETVVGRQSSVLPQGPGFLAFLTTEDRRLTTVRRTLTSVHILQHGVGKSARLAIRAHQRPDLAGTERNRTGVDGFQLLTSRGERNLVAPRSHRLVAGGRSKSQIAQGGTDRVQISFWGNNI